MDQDTPNMRGMWMASQRRGPYQTSDAGGTVLRRQQPAEPVHVMSQPQECQGEGWYDDASWTWGDYWEDLSYITYYD